MTLVYCDMSADSTIYAWGCVIVHKGVKHYFSDHSLRHTALRYGEFYALIKSLECLSTFDIKEAKVYTQESSVVENLNFYKSGRELNLKGYYSRYFNWLLEYVNVYDLDIRKIPEDQNIAHEVAHDERIQAQQNLSEIEPFEIPYRLVPPVNNPISEDKIPTSAHTIIKQSIPQELKRMGDFNNHILRSFNQAAKNEYFHNLLITQGVNISSFYHRLKNRFPKRISYKENGEKKLHLAFARALQGSQFCVCEIKGLFFVFYSDNYPESANIIDCDVV